MRQTEQRTPDMIGNTAGHRHDQRAWQGSQPEAAPITKHKKEKLPKLCLARPVTRCITQIPSCSHCMWRAYAGDGRNATDFWLLRDIVSMHSLDILANSSSHARDMFVVGLCRCDVYPTVTR
jgi:hypothetical protein